MEYRTIIRHEINPARDDIAVPPGEFRLEQLAIAQWRRHAREGWQGWQVVRRGVLTTLTRGQLAALIATGADWLAYVSDDRPADGSADRETPAWLAYAGLPLDQVPEGQRDEVRRHREETGAGADR